MKTKPRIFISVPDDKHLNDRRMGLKRAIVGAVAAAGFQPVGFEADQFDVKKAVPSRESWSLAGAHALMRRCDGAVVLALARTFHSRIDFGRYARVFSRLGASQVQAVMEIVISGSNASAATAAGVAISDVQRWLERDAAFRNAVDTIRRSEVEEVERQGSRVDPSPTPYNHLEGALAVAEHLPVLALAEDRMPMTGILFGGGGLTVTPIPGHVDRRWVKSRSFSQPFRTWATLVRLRRDVFLGYCSKADSTAVQVRRHLERERFTVLDWARDFAKAGPSILEEMERAATRCRCAVFLFTKDDPLLGKATARAVPRDNVLLEAGYFIQARGKDRVAIIREKDAKMPADLGGVIYISLESRSKLRPVLKNVSEFLSRAL